jgi:hypothetical protein
MKNILTINLDYDRPIPVIIEKPIGITKPKDSDEAKLMIKSDIITATHGLFTLIEMANDSGYMDSDKAAELLISQLERKFLKKEKEL